MNLRITPSLAITLLLLAGLGSSYTPDALARGGAAPMAPEFLQLAADEGRAASPAQAAKIAQRRYGGKVLKVATLKSNGEVRYRVKLLRDNGRVITVVIPGK